VPYVVLFLCESLVKYSLVYKSVQAVFDILDHLFLTLKWKLDPYTQVPNIRALNVLNNPDQFLNNI